MASYYRRLTTSQVDFTRLPPRTTAWPRGPFQLFGREELRQVLRREQPSLVLVPDFICAEVIEVFRQEKRHFETYPIHAWFLPDFAALEKQITQTGARHVLWVHYFGFPTGVVEWTEFQRRTGVHLIEDNAHGFGATSGGRPLGEWGQSRLLSPRKAFPLESSVGGGWAKNQLLNLTHFRFATATRRWNKMQQLSAPEISRAKEVDAEQLAPYLKVDWPALRRQLDGLWRHWAQRQGLEPAIPESACLEAAPWATPVRVPPAELQSWVERLFVMGFDAFTWPTAECSSSLRNELLLLPINPFQPIDELRRRLS